MREHAEIVVIGGGVIGCSVAYHLAKRGKKDVLLLEKAGLTQGATWHAAGIIGQLRPSRNTTRMLQRSIALYEQIEAETGQSTDWKRHGSLRIASSPERIFEFKRQMSLAKSYGLEMHLLTAEETFELFPIMSLERVEGSIYVPSDGTADPASLTQALAAGARMHGATIEQGVRVTGMTVKHRRITEVITEQGTVTCETVVNCAGMWGRHIGAMVGVAVPACALEHQYLITEPLPGELPEDMPSVRDPDISIYWKPEVRGMVVGAWEDNTIPFGETGVPEDFAQQLLPENWERFSPWAERAATRTPIINEVGVRQLLNGPIPYSADGDFVMGKANELDNFFVSTGFLYGIAGGGGAGEMMAEWIIDGRPSLDLWSLDIRRFYPHHNAKTFMYPRAVELYGKHYTLKYPLEEHDTARGVRKSPLYAQLKDKRAVFGSKAGWERANWFAPEGTEAKDIHSFQRGNWFDAVAGECRAVRERVGIIDQTSFAKLDVRGPGAFAALQNLAAANLDKPTGAAVYTQFCNERGGIESDLTICRLDEDHFYVVTGTAFGAHDFDWIHRHLPSDGSVATVDATAAFAVLHVCGPQSRALLERVVDADVSNNVLAYARCKKVIVGAARALIVRLSYSGELGFELHVPSEFAAHVYQILWDAGSELGVANVGYRALNSLRLEKGYIAWAADISPDYTPFHAGLGGLVSRKKGDFIGREALDKVREEGPDQLLCTFTIEGDAHVFGGECILRQGKVLGVTTSADFGHTVGKSIVMGYVPAEDAGHSDYEVEAYAESFPATRAPEPLYDPARSRILG